MILVRVFRVVAVLLAAAAATILSACGDSRAAASGSVEFVFGRTGMGPGEFSYPRAAVMAADQHLYVVDKAARVQSFTIDGRLVAEWSMPESAAGKPTGLGAGPDGRIYVADTHYARVAVFTPAGTLVTLFGTHGTGPGQFLLPTDVAVDADGFIYVGEYGGNDRISKFSPTFEYLFSFGRPGAEPGEFQRPQALKIAADGTLWVADACNHRICHFDRDGKLLGMFGRSGTQPGELRFPYGLDILSDGTLVVAEYGSNRLQRFDGSGRSLGVWGQAGRRVGQLAYPWAVAVDANDRVFVLDSGNNRVQVIDGRDGRTWNARSSAGARP